MLKIVIGVVCVSIIAVACFICHEIYMFVNGAELGAHVNIDSGKLSSQSGEQAVVRFFLCPEGISSKLLSDSRFRAIVDAGNASISAEQLDDATRTFLNIIQNNSGAEETSSGDRFRDDEPGVSAGNYEIACIVQKGRATAFWVVPVTVFKQSKDIELNSSNILASACSAQLGRERILVNPSGLSRPPE